MSCFCSELSILCFCLWLCAYFCSLVVTFNFCWYMFIACNRQSCFMTWVYFYHNLLIVCGWRPLLVFLKCIVPRIPEAVSVFCSSFLLFFFFLNLVVDICISLQKYDYLSSSSHGHHFFFCHLLAGLLLPVLFSGLVTYISCYGKFFARAISPISWRSLILLFMDVFDSTVEFYC